VTSSSSAPSAEPSWHSKAASVDWDVRPFIDGEYRDPAADATYEDIDPATESALCEVSVGDARDIGAAVASARRCFEGGAWWEQSPAMRAEVLLKLADLIDEHQEELAILDCLEMGKPIQAALSDAGLGATTLLKSWAGAAEHLLGQSLPLTPGTAGFSAWEPRGVVAAVTPWNFPVTNAIYKLGPALAAGNSVVLKPSELSPSSALKVAELALEAGVPAGALNVVPGLGSTVGEALVTHRDVDFITFTGSTATGKRIMELAGRSHATPLILECGGKSAQVVFDDVADLDDVAAAVLRDAFPNQGQVCAAHTRLVVHKNVREPLLERLLPGARELVPASPLEDSTTFGPLASPAQRDRVRAYVDSGLAAGAEPVLQGEIQESGGCYVSPTIFDRVSTEMAIVQEEIFGPVLCVQSFATDDEAIALANCTDYGLAATVWTRDLSRAKRMARAIRCAGIAVRSSADEGRFADFRSELVLGYEPQKASGFGAEMGVKGLESYSVPKAVYFQGL
jgi:acyl-CoA reductase-like NAD-dependent aldehyde dehydrogenase